MTRLISSYGDTLNDGIVQLSFTLPIENSQKAIKAAEEFVRSLNFDSVSIVSSKNISKDFTHFVAYGKTSQKIDYDLIQSLELAVLDWDFYKINQMIKEKLGESIVVVGGTIGTDAHTVGIDAIMNMKGLHGNYGLERYPEIVAHNLGAQIPINEIIKKSQEFNAHAILVSQTVTQKDSHIKNFTALVEALEKENLRNKFILIMGGARVNHQLAVELGYDAGFGAQTTPSQVATYLTCELMKKRGIS